MTMLEKIENLFYVKGVKVNGLQVYGNHIDTIEYCATSSKLKLFFYNEAIGEEFIENEDIELLILMAKESERKTVVRRNLLESEYPDKKTRYSKYKMDYSTTHEDLEKSEYRKIGFNDNEYCIYCGRPVKSIQSRVERYNDYSVTGKTCICLKSELAKELKYLHKKIDKEAEMKKQLLSKAYNIEANEKAMIEVEIAILQERYNRL